MVPRGTIHVNELPRNYEFKGYHSGTQSSTGSVPSTATGTLTLTYGNSFGGTHGVQLIIETNLSSGGVLTRRVRLLTPWTDYDSGNVAHPGTQIQCLIEFDDLQLVVSESCGWTLSFSELRLRINGSVVHTITSQSDSGTNFLMSKDIYVAQGACDLNGLAQPACPSTSLVCSATYAGAATHDHVCQLLLEFGWRSFFDGGWINDDVELFEFNNLISTCECSPSKDTYSEGEHESWELFVEAEDTDRITKMTNGEFACVCPDSGELARYLRFYRIYERRFYGTTLVCIPKTSGLFDHHYTQTIECPEDSDSETSDITYDHTKCLPSIISQYHLERKGCQEPLNVVACISPLDCPSITDPDEDCCAEYTASVTWNDEPDCVYVTDDHDIIHFIHQGAMFSAYIDADSNLIFVRSVFAHPSASYIYEIPVTSSGNSANPALLMRQDGMLYLSYIEGTASVYRFSFDYGLTWSSEVTLFSGDCKYPRCATGDGYAIFFVFKYISGSSGPGKLYVISYSPGDSALPSEVIVDNSAGSDFEIEDSTYDVSYENGEVFFFGKINGSATPSYWISNDYGKTFRQVFP